MLTILFLGFASGLPLALTASSPGRHGCRIAMSTKTASACSRRRHAYTLKFLWFAADGQPALSAADAAVRPGRAGYWRHRSRWPPVFTDGGGRRPAINPWATALVAVLLRSCPPAGYSSSSAYRVEILTPEEQGRGGGDGAAGLSPRHAGILGGRALSRRPGWAGRQPTRHVPR